MKKCVIVVGMHHSGTSMNTGLLNKMGFSIGKTQTTTKHEHNKNGYFENISVRNCADSILKFLGGSWRSVPNPKKINYSTVIKKFSPVLIKTIQAEFGNANKIAIKDPRWAVLLPVLNHALKVLGYKVHLLVTQRHEMDSVKSLAKTNRTNQPVGASVSHFTQLGILHFIQTTQKELGSITFVNYHAMLQQPVKVISSLCANLQEPSPAREWINKYIDSSMQHFDTSGTTLYDVYVKAKKCWC